MFCTDLSAISILPLLQPLELQHTSCLMPTFRSSSRYLLHRPVSQTMFALMQQLNLQHCKLSDAGPQKLVRVDAGIF